MDVADATGRVMTVEEYGRVEVMLRSKGRAALTANQAFLANAPPDERADVGAG